MKSAFNRIGSLFRKKKPLNPLIYLPTEMNAPTYETLEFKFDESDSKFGNSSVVLTTEADTHTESGDGLKLKLVVHSKGIASDKGMRTGDIVVALDDTPIYSFEDFTEQFQTRPLTVKIIRPTYVSTDELKNLSSTPDTPIQSIQKQKSLDATKFKMDNYLAQTINQFGLYTNFYKSLSYPEQQAIRNYQTDSGEFNNHPISVQRLKNVFAKAPPLPSTIYVYRCYSSKVSINSIDNQMELGRFLSTSLSHKLALNWCDLQKGNCYNTRDNAKKLEICIIIPKGSKVLPLVYALFDVYNEYEILLPPTGNIVSTEACHPKYNVPIFIYFEDSRLANQFKESQYPTVAQQPVAQQPVTQGPVTTNWNEWLQKMLKQPEEPPEGVDYANAVIDAYGGNKTYKSRRSKKSRRHNKVTNTFNRKKNKTRKRKH